MRTVGDFKNAGLEFVDGDVCRELGQIFSLDWFNNPQTFESSTIKSLAWRENTGEKPEFVNGVNLVDWMQEDGTVYTTGDLHWDSNVKKWRPALNQSTTQTETPQEKGAFKAMTESKPIFTQAMAGAGELPPVGSEFTSAPNNDIKITCLYASKFAVIGLLDTGLECVFNLHLPDIDYKFAPIKTEREKAIDEMMQLDCWATDMEFCEALYDANYRKLTPSQAPSQAKAYDDKTEYFGEDYK